MNHAGRLQPRSVTPGARSNIKKGKRKRLIDEPKADSQRNESKQSEGGLPIASATLGNAPAAASQSQTKESQQPRNYSRYVVRPFVTIWGVVRLSFGFLDKHAGSITALATVAIVILTCFYVRYSKKQWETMRESLQVTERAYITVGRKDGVVAEFIIPKATGTDAAIVLYFQNNGHLPAKFNWGTTFNLPVFQGNPRAALPAIPSAHSFVQWRRSRNKKDGSVSESVGVVIGGDSVYAADYGNVPRDRADQLISGGDLLMINGAFESCDEMGVYSCKQFDIYYQGPPYNSFRYGGMHDCPTSWRALPKSTPDLDYLPPCLTPSERQKEEADFAKRIGVDTHFPK
jgi:hypothetical protein